MVTRTRSIMTQTCSTMTRTCLIIFIFIFISSWALVPLGASREVHTQTWINHAHRLDRHVSGLVLVGPLWSDHLQVVLNIEHSLVDAVPVGC